MSSVYSKEGFEPPTKFNVMITKKRSGSSHPEVMYFTLTVPTSVEVYEYVLSWVRNHHFGWMVGGFAPLRSDEHPDQKYFVEGVVEFNPTISLPRGPFAVVSCEDGVVADVYGETVEQAIDRAITLCSLLNKYEDSGSN
jgi:hypothetical protein